MLTRGRDALGGRETEEDLASKLEKDFKNIGFDITRDAIKRTHRIGPVITDVDDFGEETTKQQVVVKFKSWDDRIKVTELVKNPKVTDIGFTLPGDV